MTFILEIYVVRRMGTWWGKDQNETMEYLQYEVKTKKRGCWYFTDKKKEKKLQFLQKALKTW